MHVHFFKLGCGKKVSTTVDIHCQNQTRRCTCTHNFIFCVPLFMEVVYPFFRYQTARCHLFWIPLTWAATFYLQVQLVQGLSWCMQHFHVSKQWYGGQQLGFLTCAQMLHMQQHTGGCTDTGKEPAPSETQLWQKNALLHWESNLPQPHASPDAQPTEPHPHLVHWQIKLKACIISMTEVVTVWLLYWRQAPNIIGKIYPSPQRFFESTM